MSKYRAVETTDHGWAVEHYYTEPGDGLGVIADEMATREDAESFAESFARVSRESDETVADAVARLDQGGVR